MAAYGPKMTKSAQWPFMAVQSWNSCAREFPIVFIASVQSIQTPSLINPSIITNPNKYVNIYHHDPSLPLYFRNSFATCGYIATDITSWSVMFGNWTASSLLRASKSRGSMLSPGLPSILDKGGQLGEPGWKWNTWAGLSGCRCEVVLGSLGRVAQFGPEWKNSHSHGLQSDAHTHLKELDDGAWEGERRRLLLHILGGELVLNHELGKVAHDLAARCHLISLNVQTHQYNPHNGASNLDNVTEEQVGLAILLFHHLKLVAQTQAETLMLWTIAFK